MQNIYISPSILSADFANLGREVSDMCKAGADFIHVDVMDGHFVPNLTIGAGVVKAIKPYASVPLDVHLMIEQPELLIPDFAAAGADIITVHLEACVHAHRVLQMIKHAGTGVDKKIMAGISIVPSTPPEAIAELMDIVDLVLVMSVKPGFGGQSFIASQLKKVATLRQMINASGRDILLEVDGGINANNAGAAVAAGANMLVAGSALFTGDAKDYAGNIRGLRSGL